MRDVAALVARAVRTAPDGAGAAKLAALGEEVTKLVHDFPAYPR